MAIYRSPRTVLYRRCALPHGPRWGGTVMSNATYGELGYIEQVYSTIVLSQDQAFSGVVMA